MGILSLQLQLTTARNTIQSGSTTARRNIMLAAIDHQDMITVEPGRTSGVPPGTNKIGLNFQQIEGFINGTVNMDNRTLGWGMTLMHEIKNTNVGGRIAGFSIQPRTSRYNEHYPDRIKCTRR